MAAEMYRPGEGLHVAVIMDGNGRWAQARKLPRAAGHKEGAKAVRADRGGRGRAGCRHLDAVRL